MALWSTPFILCSFHRLNKYCHKTCASLTLGFKHTPHIHSLPSTPPARESTLFPRHGSIPTNPSTSTISRQQDSCPVTGPQSLLPCSLGDSGLRDSHYGIECGTRQPIRGTDGVNPGAYGGSAIVGGGESAVITLPLLAIYAKSITQSAQRRRYRVALLHRVNTTSGLSASHFWNFSVLLSSVGATQESLGTSGTGTLVFLPRRHSVGFCIAMPLLLHHPGPALLPRILSALSGFVFYIV